jgi:hypothetical protein
MGHSLGQRLSRWQPKVSAFPFQGVYSGHLSQEGMCSKDLVILESGTGQGSTKNSLAGFLWELGICVTNPLFPDCGFKTWGQSCGV